MLNINLNAEKGMICVGANGTVTDLVADMLLVIKIIHERLDEESAKAFKECMCDEIVTSFMDEDELKKYIEESKAKMKEQKIKDILKSDWE